jgi:hypothetical protein
MPKESLPSSEKIYKRYPHWPSVETFVTATLQFDPLAMVLFGSVARGDFTQHSDADVLVLLPQPIDWMEIYQNSDGWVQPLVKTWEEFLQGLAEPQPFFMEIVEDGIVLWEREGAMAALREAARAAQQRYRMVRTGSRWEWTPPD